MALPNLQSLLLWLDAADEATITRDTGSKVTSWASKVGSLTANSTSATFAANMTIVPGTAGGSWIALYMNDTGNTMIAVPQEQTPSDVMISTDYGTTWNPTITNLTTRLNEVKFSDSGQYIVATGDEDYLYVSNDYGATFTAKMTDTTRNWEWNAISNDGQYMLATTLDSGIHRSTDYGVNWNVVAGLPTAPGKGFVFIDKTDASIQWAGILNGRVYVSRDYGATWAIDANLPTALWYDMTQSNNGNILVVWADEGSIYISADKGTTWTNAFSGTRRWRQIRCSTDGTKIVAVEKDGLLHISSDSGATWNSAIDTTPRDWGDVDISGDGQYIMACADRLYVSRDAGATFTAEGVVGGAPYHARISESGAFAGYTAFNNGLYVAHMSSPWTEQFNGVQYLGLQGSALEVPTLDLGAGVTIIQVIHPRSNNNGALWYLDANHAFYPRGGGTTTKVSYGATTVIVNSSLVPLNKSQVFTAMIGNGAMVLRQNMKTIYNANYTATADGDVFRIGSDGSNNYYEGLLGELIIYDGTLVSSDFNAVMSYLSAKWAIPEASPLLPGVGSDPHLMTIDGKRFDIMLPGWYVLLTSGDFSVTFKVAHSKLDGGLYIHQFNVKNGPYSANVIYRKRTMKISKTHDTPINLLEEDNTGLIKFNILPKAPMRMVKILHGWHTRTGHFWLYIDYKHRYITPYFPEVKDWNTFKGLMIDPIDMDYPKTSVKTNFKNVIMPHSIRDSEITL